MSSARLAGLVALTLLAGACLADAPLPVSVASEEASVQGSPDVAAQPETRAAIEARSCPADIVAIPFADLSINAVPLETSFEGAGSLAFRGGLDLTSPDPRFGGLSGLEVEADGLSAWAVSDEGLLVRFRLVLDEAGELAGLADAAAADLRGADGNYLSGKASADSESLALLPGGGLAIGFEREHRIGYVFPEICGAASRVAQGGPLAGDLSRVPPNNGLEALGLHEPDLLLTGLEASLDGTGPLGSGPVFGRVDTGVRPGETISGMPLPSRHGLTGMDVLGGQAYFLQRAYHRLFGVRVRVVRKSLGTDPVWGSDAAGGLEELARLAPPMPIDNFEAIAATRLGDETIRLYLLSDNNFSASQRTLLLAFDVTEKVGAD